MDGKPGEMKRALEIYRYCLSAERWSRYVDYQYDTSGMRHDHDDMWDSRTRWDTFMYWLKSYHPATLIEGLEEGKFDREYARRTKKMASDAENNYKRYKKMRSDFVDVMNALYKLYPE